jgi:hypothetical protein
LNRGRGGGGVWEGRKEGRKEGGGIFLQGRKTQTILFDNEDRQTDSSEDRQIDRQTFRQTDSSEDRRTDRQTDSSEEKKASQNETTLPSLKKKQ